MYPSKSWSSGGKLYPSAFHNHDITKAEAGVRKIEVTMGHEKIKGFLTQESGEASAHQEQEPLHNQHFMERLPK